jgi:hypothetical protein
LLRWGKARDGCLVEQWDFASLDGVFVRKVTTAVHPDRA